MKTLRNLVYTLSYWHSAEHAKVQFEGPYGLGEWHKNAKNYFDPMGVFVACGTISKPEQSPLPPEVVIVNGGLPLTQLNTCARWSYGACAESAAMYYALNRFDWDLLIMMDADVVFGAVNFDALLREFMDRPEVWLTPSWIGCPSGGVFNAMKREGAVMRAHMRTQPNLKPTGPPMVHTEQEMAGIFEGKWWNPWPQHATMRMEYGAVPDFAAEVKEDARTWPMIRLPDPDIVERYKAEQQSKLVPFRNP